MFSRDTADDKGRRMKQFYLLPLHILFYVLLLIFLGILNYRILLIENKAVNNALQKWTELLFRKVQNINIACTSRVSCKL